MDKTIIKVENGISSLLVNGQLVNVDETALILKANDKLYRLVVRDGNVVWVEVEPPARQILVPR